MARAKTASDERYNARRRARRELARIQRAIESGGMTDAQRATQQAYARRLEQSIQASYIQKNIVRGMDRQSRKKLTSAANQALRASESTIESRRKSLTATARQNEVFANKIRQVQQGMPTDVGGLDAIRVQFFYVATKRLWQGFPLGERNQRIMQGMGVESLEEAYRIVTRANREQISTYRDMLRGITPERSVEGWTDQAKEFYNDVPMMEEGTRMTSPTYVVFF